MKEVSVAVDGEEARISFVDHMHGEMSVIVYSVTLFECVRFFYLSIKDFFLNKFSSEYMWRSFSIIRTLAQNEFLDAKTSFIINNLIKRGQKWFFFELSNSVRKLVGVSGF